MRILFLFVVYFSATGVSCRAQIIQSFKNDWEYIRKFEKEIKETSSDSVKAYNCFKLSVLCKLVNDSSREEFYLKQGLKLVNNNGFLRGAYFYYKARTFSFDKVKEIEYCLRTGDSLLQEIENPEAYNVRGNIWYYRSIILQNNDREDEAIDIILNKAIPFAKKANNNYLLGVLHNAVAVSLMNNDQPHNALTYFIKASKFLIKPNDTPRRLYSLVKNYLDAAENYITLNISDSAKRELDKAKSILQHNDMGSIMTSYYYTEGLYYNHIKQYSKALVSFNKGIDLPDTHSYFLGQLKYGKYLALSGNKEYAKALNVLQDLLSNNIMFSTDKKNYYRGMYITYSKLGNIQKAYYWSQQYILLSDSLHETKYRDDLAELEARFSNSENKQRIHSLQTEKQKAALESANAQLLLWLFAGACAFLFIISIVSWLLYQNHKKLSAQKEWNYQQHLKEVEQKQQVQFTKALLEGEEKERKRLALDLHDGLGGMLAGVKINLSRFIKTNGQEPISNDINSVIHQIDNSVRELRRIARNMMPESLISLGLEAALSDMCISLTTESTQVDFQAFSIANTIAKNIQATIYRIVQELLTNALRHADATQILVQCSQNENVFFITIEDNGKGFDVMRLNNQNGIGISNVRNRVDYLKGTLDIVSTPGNGTTINIELYVEGQ